MTIAEYIANQLFDHGVRYVFGIPGGASIPYMEAFRSAGIDFILTSNEACAGIMADVTARLTGIPGVCHSTLGPGATNIASGIGGALLDRSPVIVFTSETGDSMLNRITQMNINHQELFKPLTKATFRMNRDNVHQVLDSAFRISTAEYPGPVHIGLPVDIHNIEIHALPQTASSVKTGIFHNDIQRIKSLLSHSHRPLLAAGLTAQRFNIREKLLAFLERYPMPVLLTPMAKGLIPEDHPCYAGVLFHALSDYLEDIIEKADLVIGLGYDPVEFNYESWLPDIPLLHIDSIESGLPYSGQFTRFTGQPFGWFEVLENLDSAVMKFEHSQVKEVREEMVSVFNGFTNHFGPAAALKILREELPDDTVMTVDVGSHLHLIGQFWEIREKGRLIMTNGWSGMGFGIPAALAAQIYDPSSTVACITGDGGFLMMAGELITAIRYNLPVIIVVFSDGELNLIKVKQSWKDISPYGTILYQGDLFGSDTFLGAKVIRADSNQSMRKAVIKALSVNEPVIINAVIDPEEYKWLIVRS